MPLQEMSGEKNLVPQFPCQVIDPARPLGCHMTDDAAGCALVLEHNSTNWKQAGRHLKDVSAGAAESVSPSRDGLTVVPGARIGNDANGMVRTFHQCNSRCNFLLAGIALGKKFLAIPLGTHLQTET